MWELLLEVVVFLLAGAIGAILLAWLSGFQLGPVPAVRMH